MKKAFEVKMTCGVAEITISDKVVNVPNYLPSEELQNLLVIALGFSVRNHYDSELTKRLRNIYSALDDRTLAELIDEFLNEVMQDDFDDVFEDEFSDLDD